MEMLDIDRPLEGVESLFLLPYMAFGRKKM